MKTPTHGNNNRRTFAQHVQATFGRMDGRKLRNRSLLAIGLGALLVTGAASADWYVYDKRVEDVLTRILDSIGEEESVNAKLDELNTKLQVDQSANGDTAEMVEEPSGDEKLDKDNPTTAAGVDINERCPGGMTSLTGTLAEQNKICQEMVNTELAMYRFSMRMFERAEKNYDRLKEIEDERSGLGEDDYADLQDNSNKLLALIALMDNDRDRYRTYMSAYEARMLHLQKSSDLLSKKAISGGGSSGTSPLPGVIGAGALALALRSVAETEERQCSQQMSEAGVC